MNDTQLITDYIKNNNEQSLEILIGKYNQMIYGYVRRFVGNEDAAFDITQETFVKVWKNLHKFHTSKNFKSWLYAIARNTALDWLRRKKELSFSEMKKQNAGFIENIQDYSALDLIKQRLLGNDLGLVLDAISPAQKNIIKMHIYDGYNFREIAEFLDKPLNTIKSQYRRGLAFSKKLL